MLSLIIYLKCLYVNLSGSEDNELLHLMIKLVNSALENKTQLVGNLSEILSNMLMLI